VRYEIHITRITLIRDSCFHMTVNGNIGNENVRRKAVELALDYEKN
jgi:hypothetical protein